MALRCLVERFTVINLVPRVLITPATNGFVVLRLLEASRPSARRIAVLFHPTFPTFPSPWGAAGPRETGGTVDASATAAGFTSKSRAWRPSDPSTGVLQRHVEEVSRTLYVSVGSVKRALRDQLGISPFAVEEDEGA